MKNKGLLFFSLANLGAGLWNSTNFLHPLPFAVVIFVGVFTTFSFSISALCFGTLYVTNHWKMTPWHWNLLVTEVAALVGVIVSVYLWIHGAKQPEAMFQELRVFPPHSPVFSGIAIVLTIMAIWYAVIEINVRKEALNKSTMPSIGEKK